MLKTFGNYYEKKDYPNALLELQKHQDQLPLGLWHYNVGTVMAEMQNWAEARYHFLSASYHGYNSQEAQSNKSFVESKLEISKLEKPLNTSDYFIQGALWAGQGLFNSLSLLILVTAILHLFKNKKLKILPFYGLLMAIPLLLNFWVHTWDKAIVLTPQLIQSGPSAIFSSQGEIPVGVFIIVKAKSDWKEVVYPSRFQGWIRDRGLKSLE